MFKEEWVIYEVVSGSHAYGLATGESDIDYRGIFIPSKEFFISPFKKIEQYEQKNPDRTLFEIRKFIYLACDNNPNVLEILFVDPKHIVKTSPTGNLLTTIRQSFLSAKCKFTYSGYAVSQLKRIKTHRRWLLDPKDVQPKRSDFGLSERKIFSEDEFGYLKALEGDNYEFPSKVIEFFNKERAYRNALNDFNSYQVWKKERNPKRAVLEAKYGYDTKHAKHLVRLMLQGEEILLTGNLTVDVSNKKEITQVANGEWTFDYLLKWAEDFDTKLEDIYQNKKYVVPHAVDRTKIERVIMNDILNIVFGLPGEVDPRVREELLKMKEGEKERFFNEVKKS